MKKKIIFKQKDFTIQEGHYTGPKDYDKTPGALEVIGKSALGGAAVGAGVGAVLPNTTAIKGAVSGAKTGTVIGIAWKFLLNYLHNPMTKVKYSEVDKNIRREFGIYRIAGVTIGDKVTNRDKIEDKFSFNDRNVCGYKINFVVADNKVIMYTFGMTEAELNKTSDILDYYCKTYTGMEYTSTLINRRLNAYSVVITFTNYQIISNFIMELSKKLETKINIMDNKSLTDLRIKEAVDKEEEETDEEQKSFSLLGFNQYDLIKLLGKGGSHLFRGGKLNLRSSVLAMFVEALDKLHNDEVSKIPGYKMESGDLRNSYLKETLKRLHYINGVNYTIGDNEDEAQMSLINGIFLVTVAKNTEAEKNIEKDYYKKFLPKLKRIDTGDIIVYSYAVQSKNELDLLIKSLMKTGIRINVFDK